MASVSQALPSDAGEGRPYRRSGAAFFLPVAFLTGAAALTALLFLAVPWTQSKTNGSAVEASAVAIAGPAAAPGESPPPPIPRTSKVSDLYVGPSDGYQVVGSVPKGARLEVVGRNEDASWLAVTLAPGSSMYAWLLAADVVDAPASSDLAIRPVVIIPAP